jgi:hypothetical protein
MLLEAARVQKENAPARAHSAVHAAHHSPPADAAAHVRARADEKVPELDVVAEGAHEEKGEDEALIPDEEMNEPIHMLYDDVGQPIARDSPYDEKKRKSRKYA